MVVTTLKIDQNKGTPTAYLAYLLTNRSSNNKSKRDK